MDTSAQTVKLIAEIVAAAASLIAGWWAVLTYRQSVKLERAKWMKELYDKFYERDDLKDVRDLLDSDDQNGIAKLVQDERSDFTDYLNFFEFLAYLSRPGFKGQCALYQGTASAVPELSVKYK